MNTTRTEDSRFVSRRRFCRHVAAATAGLSMIDRLAGRGAAESADASAAAPASKYIDSHTHLGQPWTKRGPLTPEMMLDWMDEHQIGRAVVLPLISPESWFYPISTHWVLEQTEPHRDRTITQLTRDVVPPAQRTRLIVDRARVLTPYGD